MALSTSVLEELKNLQLYFKTLYFLRWFIPSEMKRQLIILETIVIDATNENQIKLALGLLCVPFVRPSWYARFILLCFSGLGGFARGELMKHVKILASSHLFSQDNVVFMASYNPLITGLEGLQLLKNLDLKPVDQPYERLAQIIQVKELKLNSDLSIAFYKAIAVQSELRDYASEIRKMIPVGASHPYVPKLVTVKNLSDYRKAIILLVQKNLLPRMEPNKCVGMQNETVPQQLLQAIVTTLEAHSFPKEIAEAVVELQKNKQLEELAFRQVEASAAPLDLAKLIGEFAGCLDQLNEGELERHRINLANIDMNENIVLPPEQRLNVQYCHYLIHLSDASNPFIVSQSSIDLYNEYYAVINPDQRESLVRHLAAFIQTDALSRPWRQIFLNFLKSNLNQPNFFVYMKLCTKFAERAGFVTLENAGAIVDIIQKCSKPDELLSRVVTLKPEEEISVLFLQSLLVQITPSLTPKRNFKPRDDISSESSNSNNGHKLRLGHSSNSYTPSQTGIFNKSDADLEGGVQQKNRSTVVTPYSEQNFPAASTISSWGVFGFVSSYLKKEIKKEIKDNENVEGYKNNLV